MKKIQKFVILFPGRAGSSYIVSSLNQNDKIFCYPEIMEVKNQKKKLACVVNEKFIPGPESRLHNKKAAGRLTTAPAQNRPFP